MPSEWLIWQLADSAFPSGAFAHSGGLEAVWKHGLLNNIEQLSSFIRSALMQSAQFAVPFAMAVCRDVDRFAELDSRCDACLTNHVANRASRAQGQGLLSAAGKAFENESLQTLSAKVRTRSAVGHVAPVWGALGGALHLPPERLASLMLFTTLRSLVSASVRLGICGPLQGQSVQHGLSAEAERMAGQGSKIGVEQAAQTAPLLDLLQATQDRVYSRLFIS